VAAGWRRRFEPLVIGITGSIAKTSTKEAVAAVIGSTRRTLRSEGNQNNEVGLPLTVLRLGPEHEAAVLEMGMYVGGEIAELARIAQPAIGLVTAVQAVHLARIGTLEAVERAKGELLEALPRSGVAILNGDDPIVSRMDRRTVAPVLRYGFGPTADVRVEALESAGFSGMRFRLRTPSGTSDMAIPSLGRLSAHNAAAAAAAGIAAGLPLDTIVTALSAGWSAAHRVQLVRLRGMTVVDDSYNASPGSVLAALDLLSDLPGRRVAVLGEMLELGDDHVAGHRKVGEAAAATADLLIVVGPNAGGIADGAAAGGLDRARIQHVNDAETAVDALRPRLREGDVILVKASRGIGLDRLVDALRLELGEVVT
nr:UDP-N-acetylmuramoyl-tripeptide--D-alanyl-D-alanine ligase [Chloroflexota bacterium]